MFSGIPGIPLRKLAVVAAAAELASTAGVAAAAGTGAAELEF